jgi:DNA ligase (NAD+)
LAQTFLTIDKLIQATTDELLKINDVGEIVAISITNYFSNKNNLDVIKQLKTLGLNMTYFFNQHQSLINKNSPYYQKNFVITGAFNLPRHEIKRLLEVKFDAKVTDSINKNTDYLIVGENGGSKLIKANKLEIKVIYDKI